MCNVVKFECGSLSSGWRRSPNTAVDQKRRCRAKLQHLGEVLPTNVFLLHEAQGARADALNKPNAPQKRPRWPADFGMVEFACGHYVQRGQIRVWVSEFGMVQFAKYCGRPKAPLPCEATTPWRSFTYQRLPSTRGTGSAG